MKEIAKILKDNITFSPQGQGYVVHGAIEAIYQWHLRKMKEEKERHIAKMEWVLKRGDGDYWLEDAIDTAKDELHEIEEKLKT